MELVTGARAAQSSDVVIFSCFNCNSHGAVERLVELKLAGAVHSNTGDIYPIPWTMPFVFNLDSLACVSPSALSKCHLNHFREEELQANHFLNEMMSRCSWDSVWNPMLQDVFISFDLNLIDHMMNFMAKNKLSSALLFWKSKKQFYNSLIYKVLALLNHIAEEYQLNTKELARTKSLISEVRTAVECSVLSALIAESENFLKHQVKKSASNFLQDTLKCFLGFEKPHSQSEASSVESMDNPSEPNLAIKRFSELLEKNPKDLIFNYFYDVEANNWISWAQLESLSSAKVSAGKELSEKVPGTKSGSLFMRAGSIRRSARGGAMYKDLETRSVLRMIPDIARISYWFKTLLRIGSC